MTDELLVSPEEWNTALQRFVVDLEDVSIWPSVELADEARMPSAVMSQLDDVGRQALVVPSEVSPFLLEPTCLLARRSNHRHLPSSRRLSL